MIPRILIVSDNRTRDPKASRPGCAGAARSVATCRSAAIAFDTEQPDRARNSGLRGRLPDAVLVRSIVGRIVRGGHPAARRAACAGRPVRARLEFRSGDRALRRQVDDDIPAQERRPADAADIRRRGAGRGRGGRRARASAGAAGAEAAVRRARARHQADPLARPTCRPRTR